MCFISFYYVQVTRTLEKEFKLRLSVRHSVILYVDDLKTIVIHIVKTNSTFYLRTTRPIIKSLSIQTFIWMEVKVVFSVGGWIVQLWGHQHFLLFTSRWRESKVLGEVTNDGVISTFNDLGVLYLTMYFTTLYACLLFPRKILFLIKHTKPFWVSTQKKKNSINLYPFCWHFLTS